ncbi:MAG: hypothetical protein IPH52_11885 [Leptospiraceae bacterium]|nr:hypothetical protein [Leptospiraceae bacterium]
MAFLKGLTLIKLTGNQESSLRIAEHVTKESMRSGVILDIVVSTNNLYKESHEREPLIWCVNCHAPIMKADGDPENTGSTLVEEGVFVLSATSEEIKF